MTNCRWRSAEGAERPAGVAPQRMELEVRSEAEAEEESRRARLSLGAIPGVGDVTAELLFQHGFKSAEEVAQADEAALADVDGIAPEKIPNILLAARSHVEELRRQAEAAAEAAAAAAAARWRRRRRRSWSRLRSWKSQRNKRETRAPRTDQNLHGLRSLRSADRAAARRAQRRRHLAARYDAPRRRPRRLSASQPGMLGSLCGTQRHVALAAGDDRPTGPGRADRRASARRG